jgi:hypothetical protein
MAWRVAYLMRKGRTCLDLDPCCSSIRMRFAGSMAPSVVSIHCNFD